MARLNVDDEWFITDPRRQKLITLLGCAFKADGMALAGWRLAQRYWKQDEQLIPDDKWALHGLEPLLEVGLARRETRGFYVCGTAEYTEWLTTSAALGSKGGKASAVSRKEKYGTAEPLRTASRTATNRLDENIEATNPPTLPPSPTPLHKLPIREWSNTDPMAKPFGNLMAIPGYRVVFDREKERHTLQGHMDRHGLSLAEMEQVTWELRQWADGPTGQKMKSPRGTLSTFVQNYLKRRGEAPKPKLVIPTFTEADGDKLY